jgi:4-amino-4-deoxy-L-arabinose transferase-like glycosyltransferase
MKKNYFILICLFMITLLGGFLRFYKNTTNPPSLNGDEISFGYSAYSVLKTGRDEFGVFMPLVFKSVGDYKNPVPVYLMILPIKIFGLTDFAVRFPNAVAGTLAIPIFFLFLVYILKDKRIALLGSFLMSISSWWIFYSRFAYESLIASIFCLIGIWFYMKLLDNQNQKKYIFLSAFFFILTMYTAFAQRMFVPIFVGVLILFNIRKFKGHYKNLVMFLATCIILALPLAYTMFFKEAGTRLTMVLISNDIEFSRYVLLKYFGSIKDIPLLALFWLKRYLNYLDPNFLFFNGMHMTTLDSFGLGLLYPFEIPWLILGIYSFIKRKIPHKDVFVIWLLTGIVPDSLTNNQQQAGRLLHIAPIVIMIVTLGLIEFVKWILRMKKTYTKIFISGIYFIFITFILIHAFLVFSVHFPRAKGESYDEGLKQVALYVTEHQSQYKEVVFDTRHGISGPSMISNPYLYLLFYSKYDPATYQTEPRTYKSPETSGYQFNKYSFRYINWVVDSNKPDTLFIGSPWSFPSDLQGVKILDTIYIDYQTDKYPVYYIVVPEKP